MSNSISTQPFALTDGSVTNLKLQNIYAQKLGSGSFTTALNNSSYEDAGNFTLPSDLGDGFLKIIVTSERTTGAGVTQRVGVSNASGGDGGTFNSGDAANPCLDITLSKSVSTTTNVNAQLIKQQTAITQVVSDSQFDVSAAETFYITVKSVATNVQKARWVAYWFRTA